MLRSAVFQLAGAFRSAVETMVQTGNVPMHIQGFHADAAGSFLSSWATI